MAEGNGTAKTQKVAPFAVFEQWCRKIGESELDVARACGYSDSVVADWRMKGRAPLVAITAAEGLYRRRTQTSRSVLTVFCPSSVDLETLRKVLQNFGCTIGEMKLP